MKPLARNTELILSLLERTTPDASTRAALKARILDREKIGYYKYGKTMDRTDYDEKKWLTLLLEELLDGPQYAMRSGDTELAELLLGAAKEIQIRIDSIP